MIDTMLLVVSDIFLLLLLRSVERLIIDFLVVFQFDVQEGGWISK